MDSLTIRLSERAIKLRDYRTNGLSHWQAIRLTELLYYRANRLSG